MVYLKRCDEEVLADGRHNGDINRSSGNVVESCRSCIAGSEGS
jgi:hypothetical protein